MVALQIEEGRRMAADGRQLSANAATTGPVGAHLDPRSMSAGQLLGLFYVLSSSAHPLSHAQASSLPAGGFVPLLLQATFHEGRIFLLRLQWLIGAGKQT